MYIVQTKWVVLWLKYGYLGLVRGVIGYLVECAMNWYPSIMKGSVGVTDINLIGDFFKKDVFPVNFG